ncbi:hypothetical protein MLD38_012273 [Melastoma candidum]|uniref:Uncharacterized protein n=1 Tax=Melastoma candidum TaxID=119954 RepID=A0ACB9R7K4_9MYRT|nr:hypothetical protein MLD38_012273 [Melastoma candidum]
MPRVATPFLLHRFPFLPPGLCGIRREPFFPRRDRSLSGYEFCGYKMSPVCKWAYLLGLVLFVNGCGGFYLPGSYMHTYSNGDPIYAKVNSLTSIETELPFSYYSLPYCQPKDGLRRVRKISASY